MPAVILSRAAHWAAVGSMRHTVSDPGACLLSTVYSCGQVPWRPHAGRRARGCRLYRAVAAVVSAGGGGCVRPERDHGGSPRRAGAGEEPAAGGGQARRLRHRAGPGRRTGGTAAPVGGRAVHPVRARLVQGGTADAADELAVHRPPGGSAAVSAGHATSAGTRQAAV